MEVDKQYQLYRQSPMNTYGADEYVDTAKIGSIHIKQVEVIGNRDAESKAYFNTMLGIFKNCQEGDRVDRLEMYRDLDTNKEVVLYIHLREGKVLNTKVAYKQIEVM